MAKDFNLEKRKYVIAGAAIFIVLVYVVRLFDLQILTDEYKKYADNNAFLNKVQYPSRGAIYDRNGKLLVFNQPAYDVTFVPREVVDLDTADFCRTLNLTREQFDQLMADVKDRRKNPGYSRYTQQVFMTHPRLLHPTAHHPPIYLQCRGPCPGRHRRGVPPRHREGRLLPQR